MSSWNQCNLSELGYRIESRLGSGTFSDCFLATGVSGKLAIKVTKPKHARMARREARVLKMLRGGNHIPTLLWSGLHESYPITVTNAGEIDTYRFLRKRSFEGIEEARVAVIVSCVLEALAFMHDRGLVHCDVKPENVVLRGKGVLLIDYGNVSNVPVFDTYVQSRYYRAPEVVWKQPLGTAIDVWSAGTLAYELAAGVPLFKVRNNNELMAGMLKLLGPAPWPDVETPSVHLPNPLRKAGNVADFVVHVLVYRHRPTAEACLQHELFRPLDACC